MSINTWMKLAKLRARIVLADGREGRLMAVRRNARSCKIALDGRHYNCWVEDIVLIEDQERPVNDSAWVVAEPWPIQELNPGTVVRSLRAAPSASWLTVQRRPMDIHPSYLPPLPQA
jgi:hypothetical protein